MVLPVPPLREMMATVCTPGYYAPGLSGLDMMNNLWNNPAVITAIIGALGLVLSAWLKTGDLRRKRRMHRLRAKLERTCPHVTPAGYDGEVGVNTTPIWGK